MTTDAQEPHHLPTFVIRPATGRGRTSLRELHGYGDLLFLLVRRDITVRYRQTILGVAWAVLQPVLLMVVFTVFLGNLAGIKSATSVPYPVFTFAGLVPWTLFSSAVSAASGSLTGNANLISRVFFPRLVLPMASVGGSLVDAGIALVVLAAMMAGYGIVPGWPVVLVPLFLALAVVAAFGVGILLAALNVTYRDVRYGVPYLMQVWLLVSPVAYPATKVPAHLQWLYGLNPMAGVVEGFRWALTGGPAPAPALIAASTISSVLLLVAGSSYFHRAERRFADVI